MRSIRANLVAGLTIGFGCLLAVGGVALYLAVRSVLLRDFDTALLARAQALATLTEDHGDRIELEFAEEVMTEFKSGSSAAYFELSRQNGQVIERSPSLRGRDLPRQATPAAAAPLFWNLRLPDDHAGRAVEMTFVPEPADEKKPAGKAAPSARAATIVVAVEAAQLDRQLRAIAWVTVIGSLAMLAGTALLAVAIIRRALQPLARLAGEVSGIHAAELSARFPIDGLPAELRPISERLNELLARLESAFERERAFSANAAHELRTPVAELRTLAEVALKWPESNAETLQAFGDARAIAEQMEGIVTGFSTIARCESGAEPVQREPVALEPLLQKAWRPFAGPAASKALTLRMNIPDSVVVESDPALLGIIFANLFSNAVEYAPTGGEILVSSTVTGDATTTLRVANTVADLTEADVAHVFDRFWRKTAARTSQNRTGLGLSICRALAGVLGVSLHAELEAGTFVISLALAAGDKTPRGRCSVGVPFFGS